MTPLILDTEGMHVRKAAMKFPIAAFLMLISLVLVSSAGPDSGSAGGGGDLPQPSCLAKYDERIGEMLTQEKLAKVVDIVGKEPEQKVIHAGVLKTVSWTWPSDRVDTITAAGRSINVPVQNQVAISGFRVLDPEKDTLKDGKAYLEQNYQPISEEDMKQMQAKMRRLVEEQVQKGEITAERGKLTDLGIGFLSKKRSVEIVKDVGDACRWISSDNYLAVAHRNVFFIINMEISADHAVNREKAVSLAKIILSECD